MGKTAEGSAALETALAGGDSRGVFTRAREHVWVSHIREVGRVGAICGEKLLQAVRQCVDVRVRLASTAALHGVKV